jgi:diadenosine tetraphosphate (Ap4A) HIT family hydrolase
MVSDAEPREARAPGTRRRDPGCLFCRIVAGEIPSTTVAEDDVVVAIRDIAPRAPTHVLLLPREHIPSAADLTDGDAAVLGRLFAMAAEVAREEGIAEGGYRIVTNVGTWGGQTVDHLHFHLMGGRAFTWPPG